jgi:hypothetical protein
MRFLSLINLSIILILSTNSVFSDSLGTVIYKIPRTNPKIEKLKENKDGYLIVPFSLLASYEYEIKQRTNVDGVYEFYSETEIPEAVLNLRGRPIEATGYMLPVEVDDEGKITLFFLLANQQTCCFGDNIQYTEWIVVNVKGGTDVFDLDRLVTVTGVMDVRADYQDGVFNGLYHMESTNVFIAK